MAAETLDTALIPSRSSKVSKLERLNTRVLKLLTAAVQEVLEVVKETVTEYQEKTARTHRENERLRLRLQDALEKLEKEREVSRLATLSLSANGSSSEAHQTSESQAASGSRPDSVVLVEAEPETVCDLKVELTLSDVNPAGPERDGSSDSEELHVSDVDVKTEPAPSECSSEPSPPVMAVVPKEERNQVHIGTSSRPQTNLGNGPGWDTLSGWNPSRGDENHICHVCGKSFSRMGNLRIHQRCHTGEKPYRCLVCGRCFSQGGDLKKHKRVHTGEKPYCCGQCGKRFSRGENLKRHQKVHAAERLRRLSLWKEAHG